MTKQIPKIVIIGAGFGGLYTYTRLHKFLHKNHNLYELVLINKENYFLFTPLLHEVATGSVHESNIVQPIRQILDKCEHTFIYTEAKSVDFTSKKITTTSGIIDYDYLILALGATTDYKNFAPDNVFSLKNLEDSRVLKNHIINTFEKAASTKDKEERERLLTYCIVGGGPTGVELAAEISEFARGVLTKTCHTIGPNEINIHIVHSHSSLLKNFHSKIQKEANRVLIEKDNIQINLSTKVKQITQEHVELEGGKIIQSKTIILTAGVKANRLEIQPLPRLTQKNKLRVNQNMQVSGHKNVFALGDMAEVEGQDNIPESAQAAEAQSIVVSENIVNLLRNQPLKKFIFSEKGQLVSLGRWKAGAEIYGFTFRGAFAWWVWRTIYASKLIGFANKVRVVVDWTLDIFYPRDTSIK